MLLLLSSRLLLGLLLRHGSLLLEGLADLLECDNMRLLLLECHLLLLIQNALLDDGVDLFNRSARIVGKQDLLLPLYPLLLLLAQVLHLLQLLQPLLDLFVRARLLHCVVCLCGGRAALLRCLGSRRSRAWLLDIRGCNRS